MKVFVSMPFDPAFDGVYRAIESAADDNKLKAYRVYQQRFSEYIPEVIESMIKECVIFIADVTGNNPNVLTDRTGKGARQADNTHIAEPPRKRPFQYKKHDDKAVFQRRLGRACVRASRSVQPA